MIPFGQHTSNNNKNSDNNDDIGVPEEVLNKVIDKVVKARLPSVAQKGYENLYKEVKMVIFQSKTGIHE